MSKAQVALQVVPAWLALNGLAIAFSLAHLIMDWHIGLFGPSTPQISPLQATLVWLICLAYGWWGLALGLASQGHRPGLTSLIVLSAGWSFAGNGLPILACPPPCAGAFPHQDIAHLGSLLFGGWAAYASWRALRAAPGARSLVIPVATVLLLGALFTLEALLATP